jgi:hypothetical protein
MMTGPLEIVTRIQGRVGDHRMDVPVFRILREERWCQVEGTIPLSRLDQMGEHPLISSIRIVRTCGHG